MNNTWQQLSKEISDAVANAGQAIVTVDGRNGHTSSGIVWQNSFVLTAAHALRKDVNISVLRADGTTVRAELTGRDPSTDVALLKADQDLGPEIAQFGATTGLKVGELLVAIARTRRGHLVASSGILSGLMGEYQAGRTRIDQFIRPDLMLYPGFSGGALIDATGKILGMNTSGLIRGKPITLPAATLVRLGEQLVSKGRVPRPYIGVALQPVPLPESLQKQTGLQASTGLLVMHVEPGGPADAAGALVGDILIDLAGHGFDDMADLQDALQRNSVDQEVKSTIVRGGQRSELTIRIGERPLR